MYYGASAATLLSRYGHIERIPDDARAWQVKVRGAAALAESLRERRGEAELYRRLATLRTDAPMPDDLVSHLEWRGADRDALAALAAELADEAIVGRVPRFR